jgi:hypothetical protein
MDDYNPNYDRYPPPAEPERKIPVIFWLVLAVVIDLVLLSLILYKVW